MTDELMLFLALAGGFTVVLVDGGRVKHHDGLSHSPRLRMPSADSAAAVDSFSSKANNCSRHREGGPPARLVSSSIGATRGLAIHGLLSGPCHPTFSHSAQLGYCLPLGSCLPHDLTYPCQPPAYRMPKSRGRKPKTNRAPFPAAPKKSTNSFNNTPQVYSPSMLPSQEPPPAAASRGERAASKIKEIAMTLWRWLRTTG